MGNLEITRGQRPFYLFSGYTPDFPLKFQFYNVTNSITNWQETQYLLTASAN